MVVDIFKHQHSHHMNEVTPPKSRSSTSIPAGSK